MILSLMLRLKADSVTKYLSYGVGVITVLLPFHAWFTTWAGSNFGYLDWFRIWKELLLVPLTIGALWLLTKTPGVVQWLKRTKILSLVLIYVGLHVGLSLWALWSGRVSAEASIYALLINLRYLVFFIVVVCLASRSAWLTDNWKRLIIWPAMVVAVFGIMQVTVLPPDFLSHFGYGDSTIPAVHTIDQKLEYQRIQSTLRGPNPLGAYLVLALAVAFLGFITSRFKNKRQALLVGIFGLAMFWTYSRSAWIGAALTIGLIIWWSVKPSLKRYSLVGIAVVVLVLGGLTLVFRNNDGFQNLIFHTDEKSAAADSSNADRAEALIGGLGDVMDEPWGRGPGTAGPASFRNQPNHPRIAENYYLQIGQEVGILGLMTFIGINLLVVTALWKSRSELSLVLLASWVGLTLINMLSHAWADDTLSYLWWGLAGVALAKPISVSYNRQKAKTGKGTSGQV
jgi:O-Antigen ligase